MILDSAKLKKARERAKLSQTDLGFLIDVSQTTIWEWEQKDHDVKLVYILAISEKLDLDLQDLLKDGTTINIQHNRNNKVSNNSALGMNITIESYQLQQELIQVLKHNIELLREENAKLKQDLKKINN